MPRMDPRPIGHAEEEEQICMVVQGKLKRQATVLERRPGEAYVHYLDADKRLDEWIPESRVQLLSPPKKSHLQAAGPEDGVADGRRSNGVASGSAGPTTRKRRRSQSPSLQVPLQATTTPSRHPKVHPMTSVASSRQLSPPPHHDHLTTTQNAERDAEALLEHQRITARRNFDQVIFGHWQMKTWYFSPYPTADDDITPPNPSAMDVHTLSSKRGQSSQTHPGTESPGRGSPAAFQPVPGGPGAPTLRTHGRTAALMASSGVGSTAAAPGEPTKLWVCDRCFKYMREGVAWELHMKKCQINHPPGRKVYQRGAHTIWEVDASTSPADKLYCQNLALFGKLFIDVKTIFFDCENFLFYLLTDADSQRDHVLGFFSKEKVSYDEWNLACIITFPPYQKKGYGMLLIEFSYELSRRAGKLGTPERPLSDLGLRGYLAYWVAVLVRFFRRILGTSPLDTDPTTIGVPRTGGHVRRISASSKKKKAKGWHGELEAVGLEPETEQSQGPSVAVVEEPAFGSIRTTYTQVLPSGETKSHLIVRCTLMDIARATGLRHEDVSFAMEECGLLLRRKKRQAEVKPEVSSENTNRGNVRTEEGGAITVDEKEKKDEDKLGAHGMIVISADMVEKVAQARGVKHKCILDPAHVLL
ncbi:hypothetical protein FRB95_001340 [Tulasnella sp. JGI-2019a]|nr:hypothetical protein FRB93_006535 [Tulasnella sp. JGI-2019a]KAG9038483.1 hypothetical protein FRB95_001340 [Tulasnella sp. JGI-2019a]